MRGDPLTLDLSELCPITDLRRWVAGNIADICLQYVRSR